jgi:hypothetical protein
MSECGPTLAGALLQAGLMDELVIYMAPLLLGDKARGLFQLPELLNPDERADGVGNTGYAGGGKGLAENPVMFTGIITAVGTITALQPRGGDIRLRIATGKLDLSDVQLGDSIAVSGVCLTAVELPGDGFWADASRETLERTILGEAAPGMKVNLEKALTPTTRLGGHLVSGHVDGVGTVTVWQPDGRSWRLRVQAPDAWPATSPKKARSAWMGSA